jgi:hypothetical protein
MSAQEAPLYEQVTDNKPEIGVKTEVYLGDRMLVQREGEFKECIVPKHAHEKRAYMVDWKLKAKQPLCKRDADSEFYHANYLILPPSANMYGSFVRLVEKKDKYEIHMCQGKMLGKGGNCPRKARIKDLSKSDLEVNDRYFIYTEDSFQQSIEYAGRNEDNLKFLYSEFTDGFARQAFNREFQVDYSKGNVAAFKGAVIEIHNATNTNIVYSVIRNFRD